jgi:hypothetical protein
MVGLGLGEVAEFEEDGFEEGDESCGFFWTKVIFPIRRQVDKLVGKEGAQVGLGSLPHPVSQGLRHLEGGDTSI